MDNGKWMASAKKTDSEPIRTIPQHSDIIRCCPYYYISGY